MTACDATALAALDQRLAAEAPAERLADVARSWSAVCPGARLVGDQLAQLASASPEQVQLVDLQTAVMDGWDWNHACAGGQLALSMATKLDPAGGRAHLWARCDLGRMAAFTEQEWTTAHGPLVLPLLAWQVLTEGGADAAAARPVVRALAGL